MSAFIFSSSKSSHDDKSKPLDMSTFLEEELTSLFTSQVTSEILLRNEPLIFGGIDDAESFERELVSAIYRHDGDTSYISLPESEWEHEFVSPTTGAKISSLSDTSPEADSSDSSQPMKRLLNNKRSIEYIDTKLTGLLECDPETRLNLPRKKQKLQRDNQVTSLNHYEDKTKKIRNFLKKECYK